MVYKNIIIICFFAGAGAGTTLVSLSVILATYFDRYRGVASGVKYAGWSCSGLVFPSLLSYLRNEYGLQWTFLMYGAISIHSTAFVLLLREPDWIKKERKLEERRQQTVHNAIPIKAVSQQNSPGSQLDPVISHKQGDCFGLRVLFRTPMFYVILLHTAWSQYSLSVLQTTIVDYVMDKGSPQDKAEKFITYMSASEMAGRLLVPVLADRGYLRRTTLVMVCFFLLAISTFLLAEVTVYTHCLCICLSESLLFGCITTMKAVLMADYLGIEHVSTCFGIGGLTMFPLIFINPSIIGE